jgi:hypothetical protein
MERCSEALIFSERQDPGGDGGTAHDFRRYAGRRRPPELLLAAAFSRASFAAGVSVPRRRGEATLKARALLEFDTVAHKLNST